jgi:hypothetical protein
VLSNTWGVYPDSPHGRSILLMNSQLDHLLIASRLEDNIRAATAARQVRELRRQSPASAMTVPTKRRWFARRRVASTP